MNEIPPRLSTKLKSGGQTLTHGGYSFLTKGVLPEHRTYLLRYLTNSRAELIRDLGPTEDNLTAAQIILIDGIITKLGIVRCIEEHIRENSVMVGQNVAPALQNHYLAYRNSIRLDLRELGIKTKVRERMLGVQEAIAKFDREKAEREEGAGK